MKFINLVNFPFYLVKSIFTLIKNTIYHFIKFIIHNLLYFVEFIGPVFGSIYGRVNEKEFYRVVSLAISTGGTLWGSAQYIINHATEYITDPATLIFIQSITNNKSIALIITIIFIADFYRRKYQGVKHEHNAIAEPVRE